MIFHPNLFNGVVGVYAAFCGCVECKYLYIENSGFPTFLLDLAKYTKTQGASGHF